MNNVKIKELNADELEIALKLERKGFITKENGTYKIFDPMLARFLQNYISERPREKYIPEYTSEYLVAKELAYRENYREVFISLMSWRPFDIIIPRKTKKYSMIGIQVKRAYDHYELSRKEREIIFSEAKKLKALLILAVVKQPSKKITYCSLYGNISVDKLNEFLKKLGEI